MDGNHAGPETEQQMSHSIASKDFSRKTLAALKRQGIAVVGATFVPGADGTYANGERAYQLDDNGTSRLRTFLEVLAVAGSR